MSPRSHPTDLADLVALAADRSAGKTAIVEAEGRSISWGALEDHVARIATALSGAGLVAGHRVLLAMGNRIEFVACYFGVLRARGVAVPVDPTASVADLTRMLADSSARLAIADAVALPALREAAAETGTRIVAVAERQDGPESGEGPGIWPGPGELSYADLLAADPQPQPALPDPERCAVLLYTSGTTGLPRAAMLSHRALLANLEQAERLERAMIHADDVVLGVLPLFHVYGLAGVLGGVVSRRAKLVLTDRFEPVGTLDLIEDEAISVLPLAPAVFDRWLALEDLEEHLGPVRLVLSGSAPLPGEVVEEFTARTGIEVHQGYGLTEAAPVVTSTIASDELVSGTLGAALPGVEVRLVGEDGAVLEYDDPGAVEIRGDNLFSGYWPDGADGPGPDGWWATGDLGFLDQHGNLTLVDRLEDLITVSGFTVYPHEVEDVLTAVDGVAAAAVIGVEDAGTGEAVVAYVVPTKDSEQRPAPSPAVLEEACERLAAFKRPSRIEVVDRLPRSATGRVQKGRLRGIERRRVLELLDE